MMPVAQHGCAMCERMMAWGALGLVLFGLVALLVIAALVWLVYRIVRQR